MRRLFLFLFFCASFAYPQTRLLVNKNGQVIPIHPGESALSVIKRSQPATINSTCGTQEFGYYPPKYSTDGAQYGLHDDILAMWFEAPTSGTIDTVFWYQNTICPSDSLFKNINVRMFNSNIYTGHGPGWGGYPAPQGAPDVTCWGYFPNTSDPENGIAAFPEDASGPWVSTVDSFRHVPIQSYPPMGTNLWGLAGVPMHASPADPGNAGKVNFIPLDLLAVPTVNTGDPFFITLKLNGSASDPCNATDNMSFVYSNETDTLATHDWKYYEFAVPPTIPCKGWVARGSWNLLFWYVMTPTANTPPIISSVDLIRTTTETIPQSFTATIYDCDASVPARAGVAHAYFRYRLNGTGSWNNIDMSNLIGDLFEGTIPSQSPFTSVEYKVVAVDSAGLADSSGTYSYKVVSLESAGWYRIDTTTACTPAAIGSIGTAIDTSRWFLDPRAYAQTTTPHRGDDGTAGPFAISNGFVFYGDTMHYAWVGVDGAIALSKTATDTIDVNSNGFATDGWDFPYAQHHNRADTLHSGDIPKAFIAPFWADWIVKQDSPIATFGHIRTYDDSTKFVTEWDSLGAFFTAGAESDIDRFRVVLNKTFNTIEFQYDEIGSANLDTANLTGIQSDSNYHPVAAPGYPPYNFYNKDGYPVETHLHNGLCIHYVPVAASLLSSDGWNLLSMPSTYSDMSAAYMLPTAIGSIFIYNSGYIPITTLTPGQGFWAKLSAGEVDALGKGLATLDIPVAAGWNMVGSIGCPVPVLNIIADGSTGITSTTPFFSYSSGYAVASVISPLYGYWVRATGPGYIHLSCSAADKSTGRPYELAGMSKITISDRAKNSQTLYLGSGNVQADKYTLPPPAPDGSFDVRFTSGSMVAVYPEDFDASQRFDYPIQITATHYPLTLKWEKAGTDNLLQGTVVVKSDAGRIIGMLTGGGKLTLTDASVRRVILSVSPGTALPRVFALGRNYPNPFNPTTQFTVEMPRQGDVDVSIYDVLGRKLATLLSGSQPAGYHTLEWDSRDGSGFAVASGIYFIRMSVPSEQFVATQKVMLLK